MGIYSGYIGDHGTENGNYRDKRGYVGFYGGYIATGVVFKMRHS